jgi:phage-related protein
MTKMIVKLQTPIVTSETKPLALMYNEDRSYEVFLPMDFEEIKTWMNGRFKAFFEIELGFEEYGFTITREVEDQGW